MFKNRSYELVELLTKAYAAVTVHILDDIAVVGRTKVTVDNKDLLKKAEAVIEVKDLSGGMFKLLVESDTGVTFLSSILPFNEDINAIHLLFNKTVEEYCTMVNLPYVCGKVSTMPFFTGNFSIIDTKLIPKHFRDTCFNYFEKLPYPAYSLEKWEAFFKAYHKHVKSCCDAGVPSQWSINLLKYYLPLNNLFTIRKYGDSDAISVMDSTPSFISETVSDIFLFEQPDGSVYYLTNDYGSHSEEYSIQVNGTSWYTNINVAEEPALLEYFLINVKEAREIRYLPLHYWNKGSYAANDALETDMHCFKKSMNYDFHVATVAFFDIVPYCASIAPKFDDCPVVFVEDGSMALYVDMGAFNLTINKKADGIHLIVEGSNVNTLQKFMAKYAEHSGIEYDWNTTNIGAWPNYMNELKAYPLERQ